MPDQQLSLDPSLGLPYRTRYLPPSYKEILRINKERGLKGAVAYEKAEDAEERLHRIRDAEGQGATWQRAWSWATHPDERVVLSLLDNEEAFNLSVYATRNGGKVKMVGTGRHRYPKIPQGQSWDDINEVSVWLVRHAYEEAEREGMLWTPVLDKLQEVKPTEKGFMVWRGGRWEFPNSFAEHLILREPKLEKLREWVQLQTSPDAVLPLLEFNTDVILEIAVSNQRLFPAMIRAAGPWKFLRSSFVTDREDLLNIIIKETRGTDDEARVLSHIARTTSLKEKAADLTVRMLSVVETSAPPSYVTNLPFTDKHIKKIKQMVESGSQAARAFAIQLPRALEDENFLGHVLETNEAKFQAEAALDGPGAEHTHRHRDSESELSELIANVPANMRSRLIETHVGRYDLSESVRLIRYTFIRAEDRGYALSLIAQKHAHLGETLSPWGTNLAAVANATFQTEQWEPLLSLALGGHAVSAEILAHIPEALERPGIAKAVHEILAGAEEYEDGNRNMWRSKHRAQAHGALVLNAPAEQREAARKTFVAMTQGTDISKVAETLAEMARSDELGNLLCLVAKKYAEEREASYSFNPVPWQPKATFREEDWELILPHVRGGHTTSTAMIARIREALEVPGVVDDVLDNLREEQPTDLFPHPSFRDKNMVNTHVALARNAPVDQRAKVRAAFVQNEWVLKRASRLAEELEGAERGHVLCMMAERSARAAESGDGTKAHFNSWDKTFRPLVEDAEFRPEHWEPLKEVMPFIHEAPTEILARIPEAVADEEVFEAALLHVTRDKGVEYGESLSVRNEEILRDLIRSAPLELRGRALREYVSLRPAKALEMLTEERHLADGLTLTDLAPFMTSTDRETRQKAVLLIGEVRKRDADRKQKEPAEAVVAPTRTPAMRT